MPVNLSESDPSASNEPSLLFGLPSERGRWLFMPLGTLVMMCLGTAYSWSVFRQPLEEALGLTTTQSSIPLSAFLAINSLLAPLGGGAIARFGVRQVAFWGGILVGLGYVFAGLATHFWMLVVAYGAIAAVGAIGAYGVPLAVAARWFGDRQGLALGLTVLGFGLSPLITAPLSEYAIEQIGVRSTLIGLGIAFGAIIAASAIAWQLPPDPAETEPDVPTDRYPPLWSQPRFYGLWACYALGTAIGVAIVGISSPAAQDIAALSPQQAATRISLFAIFNGSSRPLFGWLSDRLRPENAACIVYGLAIFASLLMLAVGEGNTVAFELAFSCFWLSLGGWLAIAPTATASWFDPRQFPLNYGIMFTAYGIGAPAGVSAVSLLEERSGGYESTFVLTLVLAVLGAAIALLVLRREPDRVLNSNRDL